MKIDGTVSYQDLEGGFWGIIGDDGVKYYPVEGLPKSMQSDGMRVEAIVERSSAVSFIMWGRAVRLLSIKPL